MRRLALSAALGLALAACGGEKNTTPTPDTTAGPKPATTAATTTAGTDSAPRMKFLAVLDPEQEKNGAIAVGVDRISLDTPIGPEQLRELVAALPINGKPVRFPANEHAEIRDVAALVWELGLAGAPSITIETNGRFGVKELTVVPEMLIENPEKCSIVASVIDDSATAIWSIEGGTAAKHRKGRAGPDLSFTETTLLKMIPRCTSKVAFFTAGKDYPWEHAFNMGVVLKKADVKNQIETLVLLTDEPVAGRAVKLKKREG